MVSMTLLHSINRHALWTLSSDVAKQIISHLAGACHFCSYYSYVGFFICTGQLTMQHIWKHIAIQSSCHEGLAKGKHALATTSSDRSWLATPASWRKQRVKTADIIPQEAGKHYCKVETWSTKTCFDPSEVIRPYSVYVCVAAVQSGRDKMLMIWRPFGRSGFRAIPWLLGLFKNIIPNTTECKTCRLLLFLFIFLPYEQKQESENVRTRSALVFRSPEVKRLKCQ